MAKADETSLATDVPTGAGAAAILAAGIGCAMLGVFTLLREAFKGVAAFFNFYNPAGPLSGVTTSAIIVWLVAWFVLAKMWSGRDVAVARISAVAFVLLLIGFALTFPPIVKLLIGE